MDATDSIRRPILTAEESQTVDRLISQLEALARARRADVLREIDNEIPRSDLRAIAREQANGELCEIERLEASCLYELASLRERRKVVLARAARDAKSLAVPS